MRLALRTPLQELLDVIGGRTEAMRAVMGA
jgi:hypothetical protein